MIDKNNMNNFLATINCNEAPQELIYIISVLVSMWFAITQKIYAGVSTHYVILIENDE